MQFSSHKKRWLDNTIEGAYSHCNKMLQITQKLEEKNVSSRNSLLEKIKRSLWPFIIPWVNGVAGAKWLLPAQQWNSILLLCERKNIQQ